MKKVSSLIAIVVLSFLFENSYALEKYPSKFSITQKQLIAGKQDYRPPESCPSRILWYASIKTNNNEFAFIAEDLFTIGGDPYKTNDSNIFRVQYKDKTWRRLFISRSTDSQTINITLDLDVNGSRFGIITMKAQTDITNQTITIKQSSQEEKIKIEVKNEPIPGTLLFKNEQDIPLAIAWNSGGDNWEVEVSKPKILNPIFIIQLIVFETVDDY